jgi:hypothetical protein
LYFPARFKTGEIEICYVAMVINATEFVEVLSE